MGPFIREERRLSVRYEVTLSVVASHGLMGNALTMTTHDICNKGAGFIVDKQLAAGDTIEASFIMPDDGEHINARGTVVWVKSLGPDRYRIGVAFADSDLRPIPMVMRSIKVRTSRYYG